MTAHTDWFEDDEFWRQLGPLMFHERRLAQTPDEVTDLMEIDFQPSHGTVTPTPPTNQDVGNHFVIAISARPVSPALPSS